MVKKIAVVGLAVLLMLSFVVPAMAQQDRNSSSNILKQGLLGAGAGAVGGAASGGKGGDIWKGALAGAGVNIVGGALLDAISGEQVKSESQVQQVQQMPARDAYSQGYNDGYNNGYKAGYTEGYKEGIRESVKGK